MASPRDVYFATRKKHDQLWNTYAMRPLAAVVVAAVSPTRVTPNQLTLLNLAIFIAAAVLFVALPSWSGGLIAVAVLELSYVFDCADGMLARFKKLASKTGHLFDFFTDELKAYLLVTALALRLWRTGGFGASLESLTRLRPEAWLAGDARFLIAGLGALLCVAAALSLTNFVRRPELTGRETTVEAHKETQGPEAVAPKSPVGKLAGLLSTFLSFLAHYPSHLFVFAALGRFDAYFWLYFALHALYVARGWLGLALRFGRF